MSSEKNPAEIIDHCKKLGIRLIAEGEQLRTRGPKGAMTDELRRCIAANKSALLALLQPPGPSMPLRGPRQEAPLSFSQERLWFLDRFDGKSRAFTIPHFVLLKGRLDRRAFADAVDDLMRRHSALRTVIAESEGEPRQVVLEPRPGALEWTDLSDAGDPVEAFRILTAHTLETDFDLERGPLFRVLLARLGEENHGLILLMHHIISDRASVGIIERDLSQLYEARCRGEELSLAQAPQFADYSVWQRQQLSGNSLDRELEEAAAALSGAPPLLTLPWDHPRQAVQTMHGATWAFIVPPDMAEAVARLGRTCSATPFMTWLSLFGLLLSRLSGQQDLVLGCPVSSRRPETEDGVGFFVNTLVLRLGTAGKPSFLDYLRSVRDEARRSFGRRELPFERLVERLQPERSLDRNPLFQAMFVLQSTPSPRLELPGIRDEYLPLDLGYSEFDLNLTMEPQDGGYRCFLEYSRDLFNEATIRRWTGHLLTLTRETLAAPERSVLALPLLTAGEERVLLSDWSGAGETGPSFKAVPDAVIEQGKAGPERIAVRTPAGQTTYGEMVALAAGFAEKLRSLNIGRGDVVAVLGSVDASWIAGCLGIMQAGAAFLPLDPNQPDLRLKLILDDARPSAILSARNQQERLPAQLPRVPLDGTLPIAQGPETLRASIHAEDPAYLIYTSGSTGRPKGVRVSHASLGFHAASIVRLFGLLTGDRALQFASPGFDVALEEIWPPLAAGGCVTVCPPEVRESLEVFDLFMEQEAVTVANLPASFWEAWTEHLAGTDRRAPASLRLLVTGSDRVAPRWLPVWTSVAPACRFLNGYGPTEASISATFYDPELHGQWPQADCLPLGRPLPGVRASILDDGLRPVPPGCVAELCLAGPGVAIGYLNLPEATAEVFLEDPFVAGERLYRTGDRARFLAGPDGCGVLHFLGRGDDQIKRRGFRIEPAEVEAALLRHGGVCKAAVVLTDLVLTALIQGTARVDLDELRGGLARCLPAHMLPDVLLQVAELPTLPGGKLDRRVAALLAAQQNVPFEPMFEPPRPGVEETLAEVWCAVLKVGRVGRQDNFFQLGGDSIRSLRAVSLARQRGLAVTPRDFFQGQTLAELARLARPVDPEKAQELRPVAGEVPLTPILAWLFEQPIELQNGLFMALPLRLAKPVAPESLLVALTALFRRHEMLRLHFEGEGPATRLIIASHDASAELASRAIHPPAPGNAADFKGPVAQQRVTTGEAFPSARIVWRQSNTLPGQGCAELDLAHGPLFLALCQAPDRMVLLAHHACVDPTSWSVILEDLETALVQIESGEEIELPSPTISFPDWARRQRAMADEPFQRNHLGLWQRICRDTRPLVQSPAASGAMDDSSPLEGEAVVPLGHVGLTEELLVAALALAVDQTCGRFPWLLELEGHGRDAMPGVDASRVVGWFTTVTPARIDLAAALDGASLSPAATALLAGRQAVRGARALGARYGMLRRVCSDTGIRREMAGLPEADVLFNYLGALRPADRGRFQPAIGNGPDWFAPIAALGLPETPSTHPLELNAMSTADGLRLDWRRDPHRFRFSLVDDLLRALPGCLRQVCEAGATEATPANFPLAWTGGLEFLGLRRIQSQLDAQGLMLADLYPLTPLQGGMLFHTLLDAAAGEYFDQFVCRIEMDPPASPEHLRAAWEQVVRRHPALRSGVFWQGLDQPLQVVVRGWTLPWDEHDWRGLDCTDQEAALKRLLVEDRAQPFDLARPLLQRVALCRLGECTWRLIWSNHHMILDGWSLPLILDDVLQIADALARGQDHGLPAAPPFSRIAAWYEWQDREGALEFWRAEFDRFDEPTPLPLADQGACEEALQPQVSLALSREENDAVQAGLRDRGWTLNSLVQGSWALLLSRYGGVRDVCFGTTVNGRAADVPDVERIVGCCIQTLPVRVRIVGERRTAPWLTELRDRQPERESHGHLGLAEITRLAHLPPGTPLFDSLVLVQTYPQGREDRQRLVRLSEGQPIEYGNYSLTLVVVPAPGGLNLSLVFDPARFGSASATQLLVHMRTLMLDIARRPDASLDEIEMLTGEELRRIDKDWNSARRVYPFCGTLQEVFEHHARHSPEAPAMLRFGKSGSSPERVMSYGELDRHANRLAHALQTRGVGPETFVGLCLPRNEALLVGMLGVLKAGGAYVPLDPDYPRDRLELMLAEAAPPVTVTQERFLDRLPLHGKMDALCLDRDAADLEQMPESQPPCAAKPENVAFLIYTSGSTGLPKGVVTLHRAMTNLVQMQTEYFRVTSSCRVLQFFSPSFDAATWEIFMALGSGATVVMAERDDLMPGPPLFELLRRTRITHLTLTPSSLAVLPAPGPDDLPDLECLITGGEGCDYRLAERWALGRRYYHGYGPTETTICCSAPHCTDFSGPLSLGRAHPNMRMHVLDDRLRPCPVGAVGEICIGGVGVTRGYLKRPDLTEERFPLDPFGDAGERTRGDRIYRSGDLGRWRPDGDIEFAGRVDRQVKVRGYRVEMGEIENALTGLPGVDRAVVLAEQGPAGMRLLAYVTGKEFPPDPTELVLSLRRTLPSYMVPAHIIPLERIPLTINLKVDREALPSPSEALPCIRRNRPENPVQERIAAIWRELLQLEDVGVDDNFFDLGGHSLLVVRTCSAINQAFGSDLNVIDLFDLPTIRQLATHLGDTAVSPM